MSRRAALVTVRRAIRDGTIGHRFLTSLIDARGTLRVQYLGYRFDEGEFRE